MNPLRLQRETSFSICSLTLGSAIRAQSFVKGGRGVKLLVGGSHVQIRTRCGSLFVNLILILILVGPEIKIMIMIKGKGERGKLPSPRSKMICGSNPFAIYFLPCP